jgi:hypothetical protein
MARTTYSVHQLVAIISMAYVDNRPSEKENCMSSYPEPLLKISPDNYPQSVGEPIGAPEKVSEALHTVDGNIA